MIVITGASKGIGRAIAERCARGGKEVLAVARGQGELDSMQTAWKQLTKSKLHTVAADLSTLEGVKQVARFTREQSTKVTALINNVGVFRPGSLLSQDGDHLPDLLNLNLLAAHRLTRELLPAMLENEQGHLITIGSVAATDFPEHMAAYTVSKYALHGWHYAVTKELKGSPVRTTLVVPGATLTAAWEGQDYDPEHILHPARVADSIWHALSAPAGTRIESITLRPPSE
jgi:short-subunit dehydrogenase